MRTLDDSLRLAADSLRTEIEQMPNKTWEAPTKRRPRGLLVAAAAAALVLIVIGVPSLLNDPTEPLPVQSGDTLDQAPPTTTPVLPTTIPVPTTASSTSMGVYVLELDGMSLEGADIHHEPDGTAVILGWVGNGQSLNITTFKPFSENSPKAEAIGTLAPDATRTDNVVFGDLDAEHSYHADEDLHTFIWWDDGAVTRLTARSFGPDVPDLLGSLVKHDISDQVIQDMLIPEAVAALLNDGEQPLTWGTSADTPWVLVGWQAVVPGKPTSACTGVRPVAEEDWCTGLNGSFDWMIYPQALAVGNGGVVILRTQSGVARIRVESDEVSELVTVFGESDGYPPTAVLNTDGRAIAGTLTPLGYDGKELSNPIPFSVDSYLETPAGG
jgi:hypothetical protein